MLYHREVAVQSAWWQISSQSHRLKFTLSVLSHLESIHNRFVRLLTFLNRRINLFDTQHDRLVLWLFNFFDSWLAQLLFLRLLLTRLVVTLVTSKSNSSFSLLCQCTVVSCSSWIDTENLQDIIVETTSLQLAFWGFTAFDYRTEVWLALTSRD